MGAMAPQITSLTVVYSTVYSGADQRNHQSSASLVFVSILSMGPPGIYFSETLFKILFFLFKKMHLKNVICKMAISSLPQYVKLFTWCLKKCAHDSRFVVLCRGVMSIGTVLCDRGSVREANTLKPRQNGSHFAGDIFTCIYLNENIWFRLNFH